MSVGFADKDTPDEVYLKDGYRKAKTELGRIFLPRRGVEVTGPISVLYEVKPWLSAFRVEGLKPRKGRGRDYTRQMQLILQYTRAFGKITRKNVVELAKLSPSLATTLLGRIVEGGYLERCGKGGGTYYVLTEEGKKYR